MGVATLHGKAVEFRHADPRCGHGASAAIPRCSPVHLRPGRSRWAGPDTRASILDGPDVADLHIRLFAKTQTDRRAGGTITWYGKEMTEEAFAERMVAEQRLIYEFSLQKACGYDT